MALLDTGLPELGQLDALSRRDTPIHRLDPRAKLVTTLAFLVCVVSHDRYAISALMPYWVYPVFLCALGDVPLAYISKKVLWVAPLAIVLGALNPLLDRSGVRIAGEVVIAGGWVSLLSILFRVLLTVATTLTLIAVTGFDALCSALLRLRAPRALVVQLMFLYRYLFVLVDQMGRVVRARRLRSAGRRGRELGSYGPLIGTLFLRTLDRAQRIHRAMVCRGFSGVIHPERTLRFGIADLLFTLGFIGFFLALRTLHLPVWFGQLIQGASG